MPLVQDRSQAHVAAHEPTKQYVTNSVMEESDTISQKMPHANTVILKNIEKIKLRPVRRGTFYWLIHPHPVTDGTLSAQQSLGDD